MVKSDEVVAELCACREMEGREEKITVMYYAENGVDGSNYNIKRVVKTVVAIVNWIKSDY